MSKKSIKFDFNPLFSGPSLDDRARSGSPYREIPLSDIDIDPDQPRRVFDSEALAELADSIKEHGILAPILVRVTHVGTYRLIAGERRLRAARMAGLETIPAVVEQREDAPETKLAKQLVENLQRQDLTSLERALAIWQLRDSHGLSIRDIAAKLGISKAKVQRSLEILSWPQDCIDALSEGASESKVLLVTQIGDELRRRDLLARLEELTRDALARAISGVEGESERRRSSKRSLGPQKSVDTSVEDGRLTDEIQKALGLRVQISRSKEKVGQGRVIVEFYSPEDLYDLYRKLVVT